MKSDRERDDLHGPVHTVRTRVTKLPAKMRRPASSANTLQQLMTYDAEGRKVEEITYGDDDAVSRREVFDHNAEGKLSEMRMYDEAGALVRRSVYTRDEDRRRVEEHSFMGDGTPDDHSVRRYNEAGDPEEWAIYQADGTLLMKMLMRYDERGKEAETIICHGQPTRPLMRVEQDGTGGITIIHEGDIEIPRTAECGDDGYFASRMTYAYTAAGELVEQATYDSDGTLVGRHVMSGDENERAIENYDADGLLVSKEKVTREFDANGNWIKETVSSWVAGAERTDLSKLEPTEEHYRTISYH